MDLSIANIPGSISLKITSLACAHGFLLTGGFKGECVWKVLSGDSDTSYQKSFSNNSKGITNYTDIVQDRRGGIHIQSDWVLEKTLTYT
jgi:hypothetical protein